MEDDIRVMRNLNDQINNIKPWNIMPIDDDARPQELKKDAGKPRWELLPLECIEGCVKVLTFGAQKYEDNGWKKLMMQPDGVSRVSGSLMRHLVAIGRHGIGAIDDESGLPHIDHVMCNVVFLKFRQLWEEEDEG
jgi:hypothetical protein